MQPHATKTGRNDPCPCGSGRKYKQCCLATEVAKSAPSPADVRRQQALAHYNDGVTHHTAGRLAAAAESYRKSVALNPEDARVHGNLGVLLQSRGELDGAIQSYRRAIVLNPGDAGAHGNLGVALEGKGEVDAAIHHYRQALALNPGDARTFNNLGNALRNREQLAEAVECFRRALALRPDYAEASSNLGNALQDLGQVDAAIESFRHAISLQPENVEARWNESLALLMQGQLEQGWDAHEWRLRQPAHLAGYRGLMKARPPYGGEDLAGRTLLVWAEQGVGDEIFFASVLPDAIRAAGHCVVECDARLRPLYARSFAGAEFVPKQDPPHPRTRDEAIDWQCPVASLPRYFRRSAADFPRHQGYLVPAPERVGFWQQRLAALGPAPRVGISWRSIHRNAARNLHYTELQQWGAVLQVPGITFINLQYDECQAELDAARKAFGVAIHDWDDLDQMNDLDEVAALMKALDLVIAPTTTPSILAGAVGAPTWMLLTRHITWKTLGTDHFPTMPSVQPIWRARNETWDAILQNVAAKLHAEVARQQ